MEEGAAAGDTLCDEADRLVGAPCADIPWKAADPQPMDMINEPRTEDIYASMAEGSAVPLERIKQYPNGNVFEDARIHVGPRDPACTDRMMLANETMVGELGEMAAEDIEARRGTSEEYPLLLIPKRMQNVTNGTIRLDPDRLMAALVLVKLEFVRRLSN